MHQLDDLWNELYAEYGLLGALWRYNEVKLKREAKAAGFNDVDSYLANAAKIQLDKRVDNAFYFDQKAKESATNSINDILYYSESMTAKERLALYEGINALLDIGLSLTDGMIAGYSSKSLSVITLSSMAQAIRKLGVSNPRLTKDYLLSVGASALAKREYGNAVSDLILFLNPISIEEVALSKAITGMGAVLKRLPLFTRFLGRGTRLAQAASARGTALLHDIMSGCKLANSFTPSTPVRTLNGLVAISALTVGTPVLAFNEQTGENGYYPITAVHRNQDPAITYLTIKDPEQAGQLEFITTTPEHPFYVKERSDAQPRPKPVGHEDLNTNWVGAGHLKIGDKIKQADGTTGVVANVTTVQQTQEMFNLTVDEAHTFYVGQNGWLVHNCGDGVISPNDLFKGHPIGGAADTRTVIDLANSMKANGWQGGPVLVVKRADGSLVVADGNHRLAAAKLAGLDNIPYKIVEDMSELAHTSWKSLDEVRLGVPGSNKLDTKLLEKAGLIPKTPYRGRR